MHSVSPQNTWPSNRQENIFVTPQKSTAIPFLFSFSWGTETFKMQKILQQSSFIWCDHRKPKTQYRRWQTETVCSGLVFHNKGRDAQAVQYLPLLLLSLQHLIEEIIFTRKYWNPFPLQGYHSPGLRGSENPARAPPSTRKLNYTLQTKYALKWYVPLNVAVQNKPARQPLWGITDVREQPNIHETVPTISPQQKSHSSALTLWNPLKGSWGMQRRNWKTEKIGRTLHCLHTTHLPVA